MLMLITNPYSPHELFWDFGISQRQPADPWVKPPDSLLLTSLDVESILIRFQRPSPPPCLRRNLTGDTRPSCFSAVEGRVLQELVLTQTLRDTIFIKDQHLWKEVGSSRLHWESNWTVMQTQQIFPLVMRLSLTRPDGCASISLSHSVTRCWQLQEGDDLGQGGSPEVRHAGNSQQLSLFCWPVYAPQLDTKSFLEGFVSTHTTILLQLFLQEPCGFLSIPQGTMLNLGVGPHAWHTFPTPFTRLTPSPSSNPIPRKALPPLLL